MKTSLFHGTEFHGTMVSSNRIIYTPSAFSRSNLLYLQETGRLQARKPHVSKRENLSSFLFFMVISGSGSLTYDGRNFSLSAGDCIFVRGEIFMRCGSEALLRAGGQQVCAVETGKKAACSADSVMAIRRRKFHQKFRPDSSSGWR